MENAFPIKASFSDVFLISFGAVNLQVIKKKKTYLRLSKKHNFVKLFKFKLSNFSQILLHWLVSALSVTNDSIS